MSYSGGEAYVVDLVENMQLIGFKQEIAETIDLTVDGMLVKYFLPGNNKILITVPKEKDFARMVNHYKDCEQMEVFIMKEAPPVKTPAKKQPPRPPKKPAEAESADAYSELSYFCEKLKETNPGSRVTLSTNKDSSFHRLFVSFHGSISGFVIGCPPLLFLDSTPLNSRYRGRLLTATSADGNDEVFPVAFGVIRDETDENWRWFLTELRNALPENLIITFVSDFQRGLRESVAEIFSGRCFHAYCLDYLAKKLVKDLPEHFSHEARQLRKNIYAAARATKLEVYEKCTQDTKAISPEAYEWIIRSEPELWANTYFGGFRYNNMTANFGNGFYSWVSEANEFPIT